MKKLIVFVFTVLLSVSLIAGQPLSPSAAVAQQFPGVPIPVAPVAAPAQAAATQAPATEEPTLPVRFTLENADIYRAIQTIAGQLNLNYVIDPTIKGTVNINATENLKRSDLMEILETILKINGATMVKNGNFYEIVPSTAIGRQPLEVRVGAGTTGVDDQMVMQIIRMKYVSATEMGMILSPYLGEGASLVPHSGGNILLITDRRSNLRKLLEIVDFFDTNAFANQSVRLFPLKRSLARDIVADLTSVFAGYGLSKDAGAVRFVALERINSVLVVSPNAAVFPEVEKWLEQLDVAMLGGVSQTHVYKVKNAKVDDLREVLGQLYNDQASTPGNAVKAPAFPPRTGQPEAPQPVSAVPAAATQAVTASRNNDIRIVSNKTMNLLIIQASPQVYQDIERTLEALDILPRQVLIEAQIYQVTLDHSMTLGLSASLEAKGALTPVATAGFGGTGGPPSLTATIFTPIGRAHQLFAFLNASENRSRVRTLSAPSVLVSDNKTANFQVGAEVPIPTSSSVTPVQSSGTNLFAQTIEFRPTGVLLTVTPQINDSGNVTMDISQEVSEAGSNTTSAVVAPVISKSSITSSIVVQDGQTIVLGGFIRENNSLGRTRLPLLGDIPVLGALFGNTNRDAGRSEIIILITPHVVLTHEDANKATEEMKSKLKEVQKMLK